MTIHHWQPPDISIDGKWHLLVVVIDGGEWRYYLDGELQPNRME